jgi:hypothetical protein
LASKRRVWGREDDGRGTRTWEVGLLKKSIGTRLSSTYRQWGQALAGRGSAWSQQAGWNPPSPHWRKVNKTSLPVRHWRCGCVIRRLSTPIIPGDDLISSHFPPAHVNASDPVVAPRVVSACWTLQHRFRIDGHDFICPTSSRLARSKAKAFQNGHTVKAHPRLAALCCNDPPDTSVQISGRSCCSRATVA